MKALGVLPGVFDIIVLAPGPKACFIEIKADKGRLTEEQDIFRMDLLKMGFDYCVARSLDDINQAIQAWKLPNRLSEVGNG
jgi:hypothetical protein